MQDISRSELLNKLAAGWKVRRKNWANGATVSQNGGNMSPTWNDLVQDDWEGEPAGPRRIYCDASIEFAFGRLKYNKILFVRRKGWPSEMRAYNHGERYGLTICDILAKDWEVWQ